MSDAVDDGQASDDGDAGGDALSDDGPLGAASGPADPEAETGMSDLFDHLEELENIVDSPAEREQLRAARDVEESPVFGQVVFGFLPRKLLSVLLASAGTAPFMMTARGRVDWAQPWLAICQISVTWVPMSIGAALGDLLPG